MAEIYTPEFLEWAYRKREIMKTDKPLYEKAWEIYINYIMKNDSKYGALTEVAKEIYPRLFQRNREKARWRAHSLIAYKIRKLMLESKPKDGIVIDERYSYFTKIDDHEVAGFRNQFYPGLAGRYSVKRGELRTLAELLKLSFAILKEFGLEGRKLYHAQSIVERTVKELGPKILVEYPSKVWYKRGYVKICRQHAAFIYAACLHAVRKTLKNIYSKSPKLKAVVTALTGVEEKELMEGLREVAQQVIHLLI